MIESSKLNDLLNRYHEKKLAHAFLLETNDYSKCYKDLVCLIKQLDCPFEFKEKCDKDCNVCNLIDVNNLPSLIVIDPDGATIRKEQVLDMMERFNTKPVFTKFNIYVIREADRLNQSSANTLLKFLEEPEDDIIGFFITNNKENVISTIRSRCQVITCNYDVSLDSYLSDEVLNDVKIYLNSIYKNKNDILYNKTNMTSLYKERTDWEIFFRTMLYYVRDCIESDRKDKIEMIKSMKKDNIVKFLLEIEEMLKYIKSNVNIDLILDKFVIEMREYYE